MPNQNKNLYDDKNYYNEAATHIYSKPSLKMFYKEMYQKFVDCLKRCPQEGSVLEIGSGCGFAKEMIPSLITSDIVKHAGVDIQVDATQIPFPENSVRAIFLFNTLHHIANAEKFFQEADRVLMPEGKIFIIDQHSGWLGKFLYKNFHNEPYDAKATQWTFNSTGPHSGANGALCWIIFMRDRKKFEILFPRLKILQYTPHSPLRYWLCGGLRSWNLLPAILFSVATALDKALTTLFPGSASFVDVEISKLA